MVEFSFKAIKESPLGLKAKPSFSKKSPNEPLPSQATTKALFDSKIIGKKKVAPWVAGDLLGIILFDLKFIEMILFASKKVMSLCPELGFDLGLK